MEGLRGNGRAGRLLLKAIAGRTTMFYRHKRTGEVVEVTAIRKTVDQLRDPIGSPTALQQTPVIRAIDLPWPANELRGDTVTEKGGRRWRVEDAVLSGLGIYTLYVTAVS